MSTIEKQQTEDQQYEINNYKSRYAELTKPMAGALATAIYSILGDIESDSSIKMNISTTIATFACWIVGEHLVHRFCVYFNLYTKPNAKNPLYRNFKTLSSLGVTLGVIAAALSTSLSDRKLGTFLYSALIGSVLGLFALILRRYGSSASLADEDTNIDAQMGTEGWSKYTKTALVFGAAIGQLLGGILSYTQSSDALSSWANISLYGAVGSALSFAAVTLFVPLINYLTRNKNDPLARGILVSSNRDVFNNNYVRAGMTLGAAVGTIVGGLLGPVILPGLSITAAIAMGASVFSLISGIGLGFYGHKLALYFAKSWGVQCNTDNGWSYAARSSAHFFSFLGITLTCIFCPATALMHTVVIGSAIASVVGWFSGLFIIALARKMEPDETKVKATTLPWTQRISAGASRGAIIGALLGIALGCVAGGPLGIIGSSIFFSSLGGVIAGIKALFSDPVFYKYTNTIKYNISSSIHPASTSTYCVSQVTSSQSTNRYRLFSLKDSPQQDKSCPLPKAVL